MSKVLVIDDEMPILESLEMFLSEKGYDVRTAASAAAGMAAFKSFAPDVVILDIRLPDSSGFEVLDGFNMSAEPPKVIMITAFHDMEAAITSMKRGAYDYIHKPLDADEIENAVEKAVRATEAERAAPASLDPVDATLDDVIIGKSKAILDVFKTMGILCQNDATALIQGETGTGKELIARVIHKNSKNQAEPFITLDCSAVVETLLESELFGHEKGAFTGAAQTKMGQIELAGRGTLFLDEIGELPLGIQGKLLGFLERREYLRVGGQFPQRAHCRILAATHRDLNQMVRDGQFRRDLFFRLNVIPLSVPPLRERLEDIPDLTHHFLNIIRRSMNKSHLRLQESAVAALMRHQWPGNVRELKNVITAAAIRSRSHVVLRESVDAVLAQQHTAADTIDTSPDLSSLEHQHILRVLRSVGWNRTHAARLLGISLPTLRSKIRKFGIDPSET
ncbi:sigma-54-dependent transcriptional regulator [Desulfosarcina ovata]|uniref:DNA-binding transcriptional regulator NtrC n=1 Tax=Desulfosarcina ovata subsp. ovata TaxID=2752305 RepID=A0A5K8AK91_9BACT|nr:sigma-54 dependent transcriptional regulator [Desulfosarcina ovata]BBO93143.1 sigma-54-dependent Fis family transcriptional regulator [Desulfosarcina ovata subsp. ovata]